MSKRPTSAATSWTSVRKAHSKLLVVGRTDRRSDLLLIYALRSLDLLVVILCRDLVLSPSERLAVFERFFPRLGTPPRHAEHMTRWSPTPRAWC